MGKSLEHRTEGQRDPNRYQVPTYVGEKERPPEARLAQSQQRHALEEGDDRVARENRDGGKAKVEVHEPEGSAFGNPNQS